MGVSTSCAHCHLQAETYKHCYGTALSLHWYCNAVVGKTCCRLGEMCYQLHLNTGVNRVLLQSFLLSFWLTYGKENNSCVVAICASSLAYWHMAT